MPSVGPSTEMGRSRNTPLAALAAIAGVGAPLLAHGQPADLPIAVADGSPLPPGVRVRNTGDGTVYTDAKGDVLYGMDMRTVLRWAPDPARFCDADCARDWTALRPPTGATVNIRYPGGLEKEGSTDRFIDPRKAPDWTVIEGAQGPQWVYKGWHLVFTRHEGSRSSTAFDGADDRTWNTLKYVPPAPKVEAPGVVGTAFVDGAYAFTDKDGRALFTGKCDDGCHWRSLAAPMASAGLKDWKVSLSADVPEWTMKGRRVFVSEESDPHAIPQEGKILRP